MPPSDSEIRMRIQIARLIRAVQRYVPEFEAAAKHGSFTPAGEELGLTQSAGSRQVKDLESELGRKLFQRQRKQIKLIETGEKLFRTYSFAARHLADAIEDLLQEKSKQQVVLSISTPNAAPFSNAARERRSELLSFFELHDLFSCIIRRLIILTRVYCWSKVFCKAEFQTAKLG